MTQANNAPEITTYGGWRRSRGIGLFGLPASTTLLVMGTLVLTMLVTAVSVSALKYLIGPAVIVVGASVAKWNGMPLSHAVIQRMQWWWGSMRGWNSYRAGITVDHPRAWQPPGVLAPTTLISAEDGFGRHYGLVWNQRRGHFTATLRCAATSTWLADRADADQWVANWGAWLTSLGYIPAIQWVAVTVDTAPDPGSTLRNQVQARIDPRSPEASRRIMADLVRSSPAAAADVDTTVSITFDPYRMPNKPKTPDEAVAEVGRLLHGLQSALQSCGVTVIGRATAPQLAGIVRTAFDPAARGEVNRLLESPTEQQQLLTWADAGPVAHEELPNSYRHDSGISVSYGWMEAPRQRVHSGVLARLVAPGPYPKRVTLMYHPKPAAESARIVESEQNATAFRAAVNTKQGRDTTARDALDRQQAQTAATEEAMGASICDISLYATVTVLNEEDLPAACADLEARAETAKIRLRRMTYSQAASFATTLPCGIFPPALAASWSR
ncbi:MAG: SCO6880 family protein [Pseudomonas fluorescens]